MLYENITGEIIKAFYNVYNTLGAGFLEKVYEKALLIELKELGLNAESQKEVIVFYKGQEIGKYIADIVVEGKVIVEIKAIKELNKNHEAQIINYLKATKIKVGLLVNFGDELKFKRRILEKV